MNIDILDAGHGDCLLVTCGETLILVDSGPKSFKIRRNVIHHVKKLLNGRTIDFAIVTHNDDDHIGGFRYLLDSGVVIKEFMFNSLELIGNIFRDTPGSKKISFRQDIELQKIISEKNIKVRTFSLEDSSLFINGINLTPITPNESILSQLNEKSKLEKNKKKISGASRIELSISDCLREIKNGKDKFIEDNSITNKSSISFVLDFEGIRILFLGDSHPSDVINGLKEAGQEGKSFDAVKLSHHASEKNTNTDLLKIIGDAEYIICADKSHHGHPNNKTISRIINYNQYAKIHMSSNNEKIKKIFKDCIAQGYPISVTFPESGVNRVFL